MPTGWEWAVLVLIALLLFGGARLSGVGRNVGGAVREFKEASAGSGSANLLDADAGTETEGELPRAGVPGEVAAPPADPSDTEMV